jgi:hypothetical protein
MDKPNVAENSAGVKKFKGGKMVFIRPGIRGFP